jgi:predicted RNA-binding protein
MCEFKVINKTDGSQIGEDILILSYSENNELVFKDVLGMGEILESALILDVNTLNQTCVVLEHPLVKDFINLIKKFNDNSLNKAEVKKFQKSLEKLKETLKS